MDVQQLVCIVVRTKCRLHPLAETELVWLGKVISQMHTFSLSKLHCHSKWSHMMHPWGFSEMHYHAVNVYCDLSTWPREELDLTARLVNTMLPMEYRRGLGRRAFMSSWWYERYLQTRSLATRQQAARHVANSLETMWRCQAMMSTPNISRWRSQLEKQTHGQWQQQGYKRYSCLGQGKNSMRKEGARLSQEPHKQNCTHCTSYWGLC